MAKLTFSFHTDDPLEAVDIATRLGIPLNLASTQTGVIPTAPGLVPATTPVKTAPPAAANPPVYTPPPAAAPAPAPAAAPPPPAAAAAPHDEADKAVLAGGWSLDTHLKPLAVALAEKHGVNAPTVLGGILQPFGVTKLSALAPKHFPAVHAELTRLGS